jgi:phosphomannomutase/phosphoglucomutase
MNLNKNIFRAYDIRGIAYEELSQELVVLIGKSLGTKSLDSGNNSLIVGRDGRNSSSDLFEWVTAGVKSTGCKVINIGIVSTPILYFATHSLSCPNGVMITGSHNPGDYNGFKIVEDKRTISGKAIQQIRQNILKKEFHKGRGSEKTLDIKDQYLDSIIKNVELKRPIRMAIDCGNGAASVVAKEVYEGLGCEVHSLFAEVDGNFPNHHPDPSKPENLEDLTKLVEEKDLEIGLAFDGDGDRLGVISKEGKIIFPDMQMILFSNSILQDRKEGKVVFDVKCSKLLSEAILKKGGTPIMTKTGHSYIKKCIREEKALLGGEMSGHIFFNDRWPGFDDGIYAGARMLEIISNLNEDEDVFKNLPKLVSTPEINIESTDDEKFKLVEDFISKADYKDANSVLIDGVRVEFDFGWGLLRASNTSPVLVLRFEADTQENLEFIKNTFRRTLNEIKPNLGNF